jgi:hypothetical protein
LMQRPKRQQSITIGAAIHNHRRSARQAQEIGKNEITDCVVFAGISHWLR